MRQVSNEKKIKVIDKKWEYIYILHRSVCDPGFHDLRIDIYIYIYIYSILGPVKPELGVIPSGQDVIHE